MDGISEIDTVPSLPMQPEVLEQEPATEASLPPPVAEGSGAVIDTYA